MCSFYLVLFSENLKSGISYNAIALTLRMQNSIKLDYKLCASIDSMLKSSIQLDTNLKKISAMLTSSWNDIIIHPNQQNIPWIDTLLKSGTYSGDPYIDSLNNAFKLIKVESSFGYLILTFNDTLRVDLLAEMYKKHQDIFNVGLNHYYYTGFESDISYLSECGKNKFVFSKISHSGPFCYIQVDFNNNIYTSKIIKYDSIRNKPTIYLWNIPDYYNCTVFKSVDEIIDSINHSSNWWVRQHGIECSYRLLNSNERWSYGDDDKIFNLLKKEIDPRWQEFITLYQNISQDDLCLYVRESASNAIEKIKFPFTTHCISSEVIDSSGYIRVKLSWSHQFHGVTNYKLQILKFFANEYKNVYLDSAITDTTFTFSDPGVGKYACIVEAKNGFGWELFDSKKNYCYFDIGTSEVIFNNDDDDFPGISPDPVTDYLQINSAKEFDKIEIFSILGLKVLETEWQETLDVRNLPEGIYFLIIKSENFTKAKKFVIIR